MTISNKKTYQKIHGDPQSLRTDNNNEKNIDKKTNGAISTDWPL